MNNKKSRGSSSALYQTIFAIYKNYGFDASNFKSTSRFGQQYSVFRVDTSENAVNISNKKSRYIGLRKHPAMGGRMDEK